MINLDLILRPGSDADSLSVIDSELETQSIHAGSVAWAKAFQQAARDYVPSLIVDDTIIDGESSSDNDSFLNNGYPAFLVIENSDPDWDVANPYVHDFEDASDRLANDPTTPSAVTYDYTFATDITRTAVALIAQEAILVPDPVASRFVMFRNGSSRKAGATCCRGTHLNIDKDQDFYVAVFPLSKM
jgi:hypothetical protein